MIYDVRVVCHHMKEFKMAAGANVCTFSGNLAADVRMRTVGENDVAEFTIAVNGRREDQTTWVQCSWWRPNKAIEYLSKGKPVLVSGEARLATWTNKQGEMKAAIGLEVRQLVLLGGGKQAEKREEEFAF